MRSPRHVCAGLVLTLAVLAGPAAAGNLAERLPADCQASLTWAGQNLPFGGSRMGQALMDDETKALMTSIHGMVVHALRADADGAAGPELAIFESLWQMASIAWQHPIAFGGSGLDSESYPQSYLLIDLGQNGAVFDKALAQLVATFPQDQLSKRTVADVECAVLAIDRNLEACWGRTGSLFFLAGGKTGAVEKLLAVTPETSLAQAKRYVAAMKPLVGEATQLTWYIDGGAMREVAQAYKSSVQIDAMDDPANVLKALGLDRVESAAGVMRIVDKGMYSKSRLVTPAPHRGLLLPLAGKPVTDKDLADLPADTDLAIAVNLAPADVLAEILRIAELAEGKDGPEAVRATLAQASEMLGTDIEKTFLNAAGDTWVLSMAPSRGGLLTSAMLTLELKDPKAFAEGFAKLEQFAVMMLSLDRHEPSISGPEFSVRTMKVGDTEIRYLFGAGGPASALVTPAWAIRGNRFYLTAYPQVLATALRGDASEPTLAARKDVQALRKRVSGKASVVCYTDGASLLRQVYPGLLIGGSAIANALASEFGVPADETMPLLPVTMNLLDRCMTPGIAAITPDEDGITFEGYSSGPSLVVGLPAAAGVGVAGVPIGLAQARQKARLAIVSSNLRMISTAQTMYASEHGGVLPSTVADLVKNAYLPDGDLLFSPFVAKPHKAGQEDLVLVNYQGTKTSDYERPGQLVAAHVQPSPALGGAVPVAYLDGHVRRISPKQLERLLAETEKQIQAAVAKGGSDF